MKKNILLILMFISMFFIGSNEVSALKCEVGDKECTLDALKEDVNAYSIDGSTQQREIACLYEVKVEETPNEANPSKYYNYIYYNVRTNKFLAGSTYGTFLSSIEHKEINLIDEKSKKGTLITENAYKNMIENGVCPKMSYLDYKLSNVCFDDNGECKNVENYALVEEINLKQEGKLTKTFDDAFAYAKLNSNGSHGSCKVDKLPSKYNKICEYENKSSGDYIYILYNNNESRILYNRIGKGTTVIDSNIENKLGGITYINELGKISSCPSNIFLNYSEEKNNANADGIQNIYTFQPKYKNEKTVSYTKLSCSNNTGTIDQNTCEYLIDPDLEEIINMILKIIGIAVPILLIGLVTYDIATAVLAGDEKAVNTAKTRAIKRIIIAIVIFFVPMIMNLIFGLVNNIWDKNFEICAIEQNK